MKLSEQKVRKYQAKQPVMVGKIMKDSKQDITIAYASFNMNLLLVLNNGYLPSVVK